MAKSIFDELMEGVNEINNATPEERAQIGVRLNKESQEIKKRLKEITEKDKVMQKMKQ